jgi:hypothetical protein
MFVAFCCWLPVLATADPFPGGGSPLTDCFAYLDAPVNYPASKPRSVRCIDGDPSCDADATVNGVCRIPIGVCANVTGAARCTPSVIDDIAVDHALDNGDRAFNPDFQALQNGIDSAIHPPTAVPDSCTTPVEISVPIRGPDGRDACRRAGKRLLVTSRPPLPDTRSDADRLHLECEPASCDPAILFDGTFDRIQRQVFDASCALSGCHDSQSLRGGLTLERGTAFAALVAVVPNNTAAAAAGWRRVAPGSTATSLIFHKLMGPPDPAYGGRMPFGKPRLPSYLIDIVEAWIAAGAPETGWVAGTD